MNKSEERPGRTRQRLVITAIALVFFLPIATSWLLYFFTDIGESVAGSYGELIEPPVQIADRPLFEAAVGSTLHGKWSLVYIPADGCTEQCQLRLGELGQLRLSLGRDTARVQILTGSGSAAQSSALRQFFSTNHNAAAGMFEYFADPVANTRLQPENVYLIDPLGNLMMKYSASSATEGIIRDLKRLLRYSRIG